MLIGHCSTFDTSYTTPVGATQRVLKRVHVSSDPQISRILFSSNGPVHTLEASVLTLIMLVAGFNYQFVDISFPVFVTMSSEMLSHNALASISVPRASPTGLALMGRHALTTDSRTLYI